jgi:hypothetical protein
MRCSKCGNEQTEDAQICAECGTPQTSESESGAQGAERRSKEEENRHLEMVQIYSVQGQIEADIIQSYLKSHGIDSFTRGLAVHSVHPFTVDGMGEIRILVSEENAEQARQALQSYLENDPPIE